MVKQKSVNNGLDVNGVAKLLYGKSHTSSVTKNSIGLNFGFEKHIRLDN